MNAESTINSQITDAVSQVDETVTGSSAATGEAMAQQVMAQAIGLAVQNAVHAQQQLYALRTAATTAAVKAVLQSSPEDALKIAKEMLQGRDLADTLTRLNKLMATVAAAESPAERGGEGRPAAGKRARKPRAAKKKK